MNKRAAFLLAREINTVPQKKNASFSVALVYPNSYHVAMSNLGFQSIYARLNAYENVRCERFFSERPLNAYSLETGKPLAEFDLIAFSVSYEPDYLGFFRILHEAGVPAERERRPVFPLVAAGGIVTAVNPRPLQPFADVIFAGEAEESLDEFMRAFAAHAPLRSLRNKQRFLSAVSAVEGICVPGMSKKEIIAPRLVRDVDEFHTVSGVLTSETEFSRAFLIEISRGCSRQCRFCLTGALFYKFRPRRLNVIKQAAERGLRYADRVGLVGAAVSDYPELEELVEFLRGKKARISVSSLRAENTAPFLLRALAQGGQKTVTFAPEAGTEQLRRSLNKGLSNEQLFDAVSLAKKCGMKKVKLYFMIGLPRESGTDVIAIAQLLKRTGAILPVSANIGIFVPKPGTPFAEQPLEKKNNLRRKIRLLRRELLGKRNIEIRTASIAEAFQEALFSRASADFFPAFFKKIR